MWAQLNRRKVVTTKMVIMWLTGGNSPVGRRWAPRTYRIGGSFSHYNCLAQLRIYHKLCMYAMHIKLEYNGSIIVCHVHNRLVFSAYHVTQFYPHKV